MLEKNNDSDIKIDNDFYSASLNEKGQWVYKAKILPVKDDGKYKDVPRFPMIYEYEDEFKKLYSNQLKQMIVDITKKLIKFNKQQK